MRFFLDTADPDEARRVRDWGLLDGALVRPDAALAAGVDYRRLLADVAQVSDGPDFATVSAGDAKLMYKEARELQKLGKAIVIRVPMSREGLRVVRLLNDEQIATDVGLVFTAGQALLAARAGSAYVPVQDAGDTMLGWLDCPASGPRMMLNFHLDTFPVCAGWDTDPFAPQLKDGRVYGLGADDMKGGAACVLGAVEALVVAGIELGGRLIVSATTDEENWSRDAQALIGSGLLEGCQLCLISEPSFPATLAVGARGRHVFRLTLRGQASHAACGEGVNAVLDAAKVVARLEEIEVGFDERFGIGGSLCVIGFHGGGTLILVPEEAQVIIDRHILPGQTVEEAMRGDYWGQTF